MSDKIKIALAVLCFIAALVLPLVALGVGWYNWDVKIGLAAMIAAFVFFFALGSLLLFRVRDMGWLTVSLPYLLGIGYTLSPDLLPLGADDAAFTAAGSLISYLLALRKDPRTPRWIILPLLLGAGYILLGGPIPGGLDELLVNLLALIVAGLGVRRASNAEPEKTETD